MIKETLKSPYDFRPLLKRFVEGEVFSHHEETRKRPNRRFGYEYPGRKSVTKAKVGVLADTSGSMSKMELEMAAGCLHNINETCQVVLFEVDAAIHDIREYTMRGFDNILKGGGGTSFDSVFNLLRDKKKYDHLLENLPNKSRRQARRLIQDIKCLIIVTDGELFVGTEKPKIPVIWALTSKAQKCPVEWGKEVYLDNKPEKHQGE